jgi:predicted DNA-binding protein with PD1-like motif
MEAKLINEGPQKTWAIIFKTGDEVTEGLKFFAMQQKLSASQFTAIGAFSDCVLGFFNFETREYQRIPMREQTEVLSMLGDVALDEGKPRIHAHVVLGKSDVTAHGGHLLEAHVRPTLEVILIESPAHLKRVHDPTTGLALIQLEHQGKHG